MGRWGDGEIGELLFTYTPPLPPLPTPYSPFPTPPTPYSPLPTPLITSVISLTN
ncbi:MAG: hypothetical protein DSM106950_20755 [Stigonema ocellatum SAG 48.90 = DSM 106950]|nr:hypothetical protein [Stigonema ocellatum SAG 48.90 = DSM 106950]